MKFRAIIGLSGMIIGVFMSGIHFDLTGGFFIGSGLTLYILGISESSENTVNKNHSLESEKANLVASQSTSNKRDMGNSQDTSKSKEKKQ